MIRHLTAFAMAAIIAVSAAWGTEASEDFIAALVGDLKAQAEAEGEGSTAVRTTLEDNLATAAIGRFLLAGKAADKASPSQREKYDALFPSYIAAAYAEEIGQLTARDIRVKGSLERRPGDVIVQSELFDKKGAKRASIDWRVRVTEDGEQKLLDVLVERISPLITRRQNFSQIVRDDGLDGLLVHMEETIAAGITIEGDGN